MNNYFMNNGFKNALQTHSCSRSQMQSSSLHICFALCVNIYLNLHVESEKIKTNVFKTGHDVIDDQETNSMVSTHYAVRSE